MGPDFGFGAVELEELDGGVAILGGTGELVCPWGRSEGILPLYCGANAHYVPAKRGQDGLVTQGRDALATIEL